MAKKSKKAAKPKAAKKTTKKTATTKARHAKPRERALPGLEDARIKSLDEVCDSISECRASINELKGEEADLEKKALKEMHTHRKSSWRHAGVELVLIPGEERLRVRTTKANATAEVEAEPEGDPLETEPEQPTLESIGAEELGSVE